MARLAMATGDVASLLDQHFLVDESVAELLTDIAEVSKRDTVLEVGAGLGIITSRLARVAGRVYAVEKDGRLIPHLMKMAASYPNVEVLHGDFTRLRLPPFSKVVANPPFQIVEHLLNRVLLLNQAPMTLILPAHLAHRLADPNRSLLSFKMGLAYTVEVVRPLDPDAFNPPTKRRTAVTMLRHRRKSWAAELLIDVFRQGDKKVRNALRDSLARHTSKRIATRMVELSLLAETILNKRVAMISLAEAQAIGEVARQHFYPRPATQQLWPR